TSDRPVPGKARSVCALVLVWSRGEPARAGEVLLPPARGGAGVFGRGDETTAGPEARVVLQRQRPGRIENGRPLVEPFVSHPQMRLRWEDDRIVGENPAKRGVLVGGRVIEGGGVVSPGQRVEIGGRLLFYWGRRPAEIPSLRHATDSGRFGE